MLRKEYFESKLNSLKVIISEEIAKSEQGLETKLVQQLKTIREELNMMARTKGYIPIFSTIIIDSWDYDNPLGQELMDLLTFYQKRS